MPYKVPRELICLFMQTFSGFRSPSPSYAVLVQCTIFANFESRVAEAVALRYGRSRRT